jgi:DNA-binding Lrp family transcriptional regulator
MWRIIGRCQQTAQVSRTSLNNLYSDDQQSPTTLHDLTTAADEQEATMRVDSLDAAVIGVFAENPRLGELEAARRLGVARGTVQARINRLTDARVITEWGPHVSPSALGYPVTAFVTLEIRQGFGHEEIADHLASIPEVIEAHTITGDADMLVRVVATDNLDLQRVIDNALGHRGIVRSSSVIALQTHIEPRVRPLVARLAEVRNVTV